MLVGGPHQWLSIRNIYLDSASRRQRGLLSTRTPSGQAATKFGLAVDRRGWPTLWRLKGYHSIHNTQGWERCTWVRPGRYSRYLLLPLTAFVATCAYLCQAATLHNPHQDLRPQTFRFTGISWRLEFQHLAKLQGPSLSPYFFFLRQLRNTSFVIFAILVCRRKMALYLSQSHVDCLLKRSCSALWCNSLWPSYLRTLLPNWPVARTVWWLILNNFWE